MRQTGLALMHPLAIHSIAIADQDPGPAVDQSLEGRLIPARLHLEQGDCRVDHHPQPRQYAVLIPGGLVNVVDLLTPGLLSNGLVMGLDRLGDALDRALDGSPADGHPQDRPAKHLHRTSTASLSARHLPDERRQPGAIPVTAL